MTKPFNIHDWQAKQRLNEAQYGKYFGKDDDFKGVPVGSGSEYEPTDADQEVINGRIMGEIFDLVRHNNLDPEDVMDGFADEFNIAFEFGRASGMEEMSTTGTGASFNAGSGEGYMTPNAFKKKKK